MLYTCCTRDSDSFLEFPSCLATSSTSPSLCLPRDSPLTTEQSDLPRRLSLSSSSSQNLTDESLPEWNPEKDLTEEEAETQTEKHFLGRECGQRSLEHSRWPKDIEGVGVVALVGRVRHLAARDATFSFGFTTGSPCPFYSSPRD